MYPDERALRCFIVSNFFVENEADFSNIDSFFEKGIIDSTGMLEVVQHIEETYGISVAEEDLVPANLDSIAALVCFIRRKASGGCEFIQRVPDLA